LRNKFYFEGISRTACRAAASASTARTPTADSRATVTARGLTGAAAARDTGATTARTTRSASAARGAACAHDARVLPLDAIVSLLAASRRREKPSAQY
jgi:hypothetical protein